MIHLDQDAGLAYLRRVVEDAKASGLTRAIARGVSAPPQSPAPNAGEARRGGQPCIRY